MPSRVHDRCRHPFATSFQAVDPHPFIAFGYSGIVLLVALENMGLPLPGETTLLAAATFAAASGRLSIAGVIIAAAAGAVLGGTLGYAIGRQFGFRLALHYGPRAGLTEARLKVGQLLFRRHGGKVVFFGRFVALLRVLAAVLAGTNRMGWIRFSIFNAAGAIVWATCFGVVGYVLGEEAHRASGLVAAVGFVLAVTVTVAGWSVLRRHEKELEREAELAIPGPLALAHPRDGRRQGERRRRGGG
jgi:membrane protein DedA with SNARE-associated domain